MTQDDRDPQPQSENPSAPAGPALLEPPPPLEYLCPHCAAALDGSALPRDGWALCPECQRPHRVGGHGVLRRIPAPVPLLDHEPPPVIPPGVPLPIRGATRRPPSHSHSPSHSPSPEARPAHDHAPAPDPFPLVQPAPPSPPPLELHSQNLDNSFEEWDAARRRERAKIAMDRLADSQEGARKRGSGLAVFGYVLGLVSMLGLVLAVLERDSSALVALSLGGLMLGAFLAWFGNILSEE